ncbi:hypothetical protein AURDEDRAFT_119357 [Auricularia subglabra TFB-10046 SS5]|nr:hypothetical protein AURDEDRAFT_119357 [Auricularia subglabra TFB-10046 SS5]
MPCLQNLLLRDVELCCEARQVASEILDKIGRLFLKGRTLCFPFGLSSLCRGIPIVLFAALVSGVSRRGAAPGKNQKGVQRSVQDTATPESQDLDDFNPHVQPGPLAQGAQLGEDDVDELDEDSDDPSAGPHVHFDNAPQTPTQDTDGGRENALDRTPEPPRIPSTPNSLGRYLLGHQRSASDTELYHRPSHVKARLAEPQDEELDKTWHRWYIFNNEDRRKRHSEMRKQLVGTSHDISASTGATLLSFLGRPEKDPAHPERLGEMIVSRDIKRNKKLYKIAQELFDQFKKLIASPRRHDYEGEFQRAIQARDAHDAAVQQYESDIAARKQAALGRPVQPEKPAQRGRQKRKRTTRKGKEKAEGESEDASSSARDDEDAPDLDATPRRPPPNLRNRRTRGQGRVVQSDEEDESEQPPLPEPQRLFAQSHGTLGIEDMALDDEDFSMQLGEAAVRNRRENEALEFRRSKGGESSGRSAGSSSSAQLQAVDDGQDGHSSRSRISDRRSDADASDRSTSSRHAGPSTRSAARLAGPSGSTTGGVNSGSRPGTAQNVSRIFVGPSGLVPEVVLPLLPRPFRPAPAAAQGPPAQPVRVAHPQPRALGPQQAGLPRGPSHSTTDSDSASGIARSHQSTFRAPGAIPPGNNAAMLRSSRSAVAPASMRGRSPPASDRAHSPPASIRAQAPADHHRAPPSSNRARSPSTSTHGRSLPGHPLSPPQSVPPTLDAGATSEPEAYGSAMPASELPVRLRDWLVVHRIARAVWVDVEMAYFTGLAELPTARRAAWTAELEQLQGGLLINASQLKELVLVMLRCAVDH